MGRFLLLLPGAALLAALGGSSDPAQRVGMVAMKFDFLPDTVRVKKGRPVALELSSLDRLHGFSVPGLGIDADIPPGPPTILRFTPTAAGVFPVHCDVFCGDGHEGMAGAIIVEE
jgi:cytochrome c oxidase subunit II